VKGKKGDLERLNVRKAGDLLLEAFMLWGNTVKRTWLCEKSMLIPVKVEGRFLLQDHQVLTRLIRLRLHPSLPSSLYGLR